MMARTDRRDDLLIQALIANPTVRAAAKAAGIGETAAYARMKDPDFLKRYDAARYDLLKQNTAAVQGHIRAAIDAMGEIVNDPDTPQQIRLNAAEAIIRTALKLTEQTDILTRLAAVEERLKV